MLALPGLPAFHWLLLLAVPALLPWRGRALYAVAVLGALLCLRQAQSALDQRWPLEHSDDEVEIAGRVADLPERHVSLGSHESGETAGEELAGTQRHDWRFRFEPLAGEAYTGRIEVSWYRGEESVKGGDCWKLVLRMRAPHGSLNPGGFDFERWLFEQDIGAIATVRGAQRCTESSGYRLLRARQAIADQVEEWLPQHPALGLVEGLAVGDRSLLRQQDWDVFRITGTSHLMAIAGLHIGMVVAAVFLLLRWIWALVPGLCLRLPAQKAGMLGAVLFGSAYAFLSGFEAPAQRAWLMLVFGFAALWADRPALLPRALALVWFAVVAANPLALLSPGLWLSFTAVAAIFWAGAGRLHRRPHWQQFLLLQLSLSVGLLPLTFFFFQGGGWIGPLANLVVVPVFTVLLPVLLASLAVAAIWPAVGVSLLGGTASAILWVREGLGWAAAHAPHAWLPASPDPWALLLAVVGIAALFAPGRLLAPFGAVCLLPLLLAPGQPPAQGFRVAVLDVGQGLSVVVRTARHALLFDTGPAFGDVSDSGRSEVVPYLLAVGIARLDIMIISHADLDHRGGAPAVRAAIPIAEELGALSDRPCVAGQSWSWDGVDFEILNPPAEAGNEPHARNNGGCVLRVAAGDHAALLPADIEAPAERRLLSGYPAALHADLIVAPHHGSKTSSTEPFVQAVAPKLVIYSSGWHNRFQFPRAPVVERYRQIGAQAHMTGNEGTVTVDIDPQGLHAVSAMRRDHPRLWREPPEPVPDDNP